MSIKLTVALPVYNSKSIAWLAMESLCNQKGIDFDWEIVIAEENVSTPNGVKVYRHSVYVGYENMLTDNLKALKFFPGYVQSLVKLEDVSGADKPYRRIKSKDIHNFISVYDEIDVSVVPLRPTLFNSCKSNLKLLEAGFMDCGVIVSDIAPYTPLATKDNSFRLSEKNFYEWQRYILQNPNASSYAFVIGLSGTALKNLSILCLCCSE